MEIGASPKNRRRRGKVEEGSSQDDRAQSPLNVTNGDYYEDSDEDKDHRSDEEKIFGSACALGQFCLNPCLCLFMAGRFYWRRKRWQRKSLTLSSSTSNGKGTTSRLSKRLGRRNLPMGSAFLGGTFLCGVICLYSLAPIIPRMQRFRYHRLRPVTDWDVNQVQILVSALDIEKHNIDLGHWIFRRRFYQPDELLDFQLEQPDFGDLTHVMVHYAPRQIHSDDEKLLERYREKRINHLVVT